MTLPPPTAMIRSMPSSETCAPHLGGNDHFLYFRTARADRADFYLPIKSLDRIIMNVAITAEDLHAIIGYAQRRFGDIKFGDGRFHHRGLAFFQHASDAIDEQARRINGKFHIRK